MPSRLLLPVIMKRPFVTLLCFLLSCTAAHATVYYVDGSKANNTGAGTSWATAKKDVQAAINIATVAGDEVWVKAGTYLPTLDPNSASPTDPRDKTFYIRSTDIKLYGGFNGTESSSSARNATANATILSGDLDGSTGTADAYHVLLTQNRTSACVVDGFAIRSGRANGTSYFVANTPSVSIFREYGAGMYNRSSSPTVSACVFSGNSATTYGGGMHNNNSNPSVTACTFSANTAGNGGGMENTSSNPSVSACTFSGNTAVFGGGMENISCSPTVSVCTFSANTAVNDGGGIYNNSYASPAVSNCIFSTNSATYGGGMYNTSYSTPSVSACTFSANAASSSSGGGVYYNFDAGGTITNSILYGNTSNSSNQQNIYKIGPSGTLTVSYSLMGGYTGGAAAYYTIGSGVIGGNPLFITPMNPAGTDGRFRTADDGLRISCTSPARDAGTGTTPLTDILGNPRVGIIDMGAYEADAGCPDVLYVDGSRPDNSGSGYGWASAKKDVQAAINAVAAGGEIWVKGGTYLPTEDPSGNAAPSDLRDKTFYLTTKDVKLYGGFSGTETTRSQRNPAIHVTTLSGDLDTAGVTNDAYHVVVMLTRSQACVLDGFTIRGGRATGSGTSASTYDQSKGGGIYNTNGSLATVSNCILTANTASSDGGGFYNANSSSPTVTGCIFSANTAANGGGMMSTNSSNATLTGCVFSANSATNGGGMYSTNASGGTMSTCLFGSNTAQKGGGVYHDNGPIAISSSTFTANTASTQGGGAYLTAISGGSIINSIFSGNTGGPANRQNIYKDGTNAPLTVSYSLIGDYSAGATNNYTSGSGIITGNPLFVNSALPAGTDGAFRTSDDGLRISCASPARNAGTGTTPAADILGNPRIFSIDLGAYEADASCLSLFYVDGSKATNSGDGLSWAAAKKDLQAAINLAINNGDEIWVKAGTYLPTLDPNGGTGQRDNTFYLTTKDVKLYGGFSGTETTRSQRNPATHVTTLSGDLDGPGGTADAYHVLLTLNRTSACVVDGFTISGGRANGTGAFPVTTPSAGIDRGTGGGMNNDASSSPSVSACVFSANTADLGGGMYNSFSSPTVSGSTFSANTVSLSGGGMYNTNSSSPAVSGCIFSANTATNSGGGMENDYCSPSVSACIFSANTASYGGGMLNLSSSPAVNACVFSANMASYGSGMCNSFSSMPSVSTCTFSANTASSSGGGGMYYDVSSGGSITNGIFYGNTGGPTNQQNIYKDGTSPTLTVSHSLIGDYSAGATNNYTSGAGIITADPLFVSSSSPAGADGTFRTADDGLALQSCSPAVNSGTGTTPATDLSGNSRVGTLDLGAYEYQGAPSSTLAGSATTDSRSPQGGSALAFGTCGAAIASLSPSGAAPVTGSIAAKVYVQSTAPSYNQMFYVRRYYDITPATNPNTATAQITLYFSQADFTNYNTVRGSLPPLPVDAADAANNKGNLRITQEHGTSATGLPGSYSGWSGTGPAKVLITPMSVSWNATFSRWEVLFPVTGFSGFFATSAINRPLPVELLSFSARLAGEHTNQLDWTTGEEEGGLRFTVERSSDAKSFRSIGAVAGTGHGSTYRFMDVAPLAGDNYYRLQVPAVSGEVRYSQTVLVKGSGATGSGTVALSPNPATGRVTIVCTDKALEGSQVRIWSAEGRLMHTFVLERETTLDVHDWAVGVYLLRLQDGSTLRLIKN
ncbi:MAG: T9SS type A sorting domain-containing protein [Sphingobacteriales bacterium]|nr:MAG: T9SS type A sorting domain-containing protein [Sphingobacteriales bacterium]